MPEVAIASHSAEDHHADILGVAEGELSAKTSSPAAFYFGRFGTFFLDQGHSKKSPTRVHNDLMESLKSDSRVVNVIGADPRPAWSAVWTAFPEDRRGDADDLLSGKDHFHPLELSDSITFEAYVPIKNQPKFGEIDDISTDRYWASWDGITLVVIWKREGDSRIPARSAGHVIEDVLRTAAERTGGRLVVQACSTGCTNMFAHRDLRITQWNLDEGEKKRLVFDGVQSRLVDLRIHTDGTPLQLSAEIHSQIEQPSAHFAKFKNLSRRIVDIEHLARDLVDELLLLDYQSLEQSRRNPFVRFGRFSANIWRALRGRGEGRRGREIIASLWIAMSRVESLQRDWLQVQRRFTESSLLRGRSVLYDIDRKDDDTAVPAINTQFVRAAVEHKATRRDSRLVTLATIGGGVAGAISASVIAAFAGAGAS